MLPGRGKLSFILEVVADMRPGVSDPIPLARVVSGIDELDEELTVYAPAGSPVSPGTPVYLVDEELAAPPEGTEYVLEVSLMRNVIKVWSAWRNGAAPSIPRRARQSFITLSATRTFPSRPGELKSLITRSPARGAIRSRCVRGYLAP
jgi:hypothetical protein